MYIEKLTNGNFSVWTSEDGRAIIRNASPRDALRAINDHYGRILPRAAQMILAYPVVRLSEVLE